jgi:pimeloyl-ACP methyl ester carboxylesterase
MSPVLPSWWCRAALAGLALVLGAGGSVLADLIFLKDGFVLQGRVRREGVTEFDTVGKEPVFIPKGFFLLDDGPRNIYFSPTQARIVDKKAPPVEERVEHKTNKILLLNRLAKMPPLLEVLDVGDWNSRWERTFTFRYPDGAATVPQHLGLLTPYWARVDATARVWWSEAYLTQELGPDTVQALLASHPDFQPRRNETPDQTAARRMRLCDFLAQAGWYDQAEEQLDRLLREVPAQKGRVEVARASLNKLRARERFEDIKRLHEAGRYQAARQRIEQFPARYATDQALAQLAEIRAGYEAADRQLDDARRYLEWCSQYLEAGADRTLAQAGDVIRAELHPSNVDRLEAFLGQARQAERQIRKGRAPDLKLSELLSLAVTGWLLGNPSAEAQPAAALRLWQARLLVLRYLNQPDLHERQQLLDTYLKTKSLPALDEVMQMIPLLPPPEQAVVPADGLVEMKLSEGERNEASCLVQLPPEYSHRRAYPVLVVLHHGGEKPAAMLRRWRQAAADNGYILAAPDWEQGTGGEYGYSEREHATVLGAVRELRRRFQVDSDRVFLFGLGEGGKMAFDVGLSHPDLFAGVLPMGAWPELFVERYWRNGQYLPFYVVCGNRAGDLQHRLRQQFTYWLPRGFPMLWVEYKGRGVEWLAGEVPNMFDWMRGQRRAFPRRQLGTDGMGGAHGTEFCTMRAGDNRFYWLSTDAIDYRHRAAAGTWNGRVVPATLQAHIAPENNEIQLRLAGVNQVTIWLGRNARGESLIDFDQPVSVWVGLQRKLANQGITPRLATLLEDLYLRGDRQVLYPARIDLDLR